MTMNRRLIRPNLADIREKENREREAAKKKIQPPYDTHAENYYYLKQMNKKTLMAVVFADGQTIEGYIEWYDRNTIKLNRDNAPNLLIYKANIKYIYKLDETPDPEEEDKKKKK